MRRVLVVGGSVVVVLGAIGAAGRWRPAALVGPAAAPVKSITQHAAPRVVPGNVEPVPVPDPPLQAVAGSRLEVRRLLAAKEFEKLTRLIEAKQVRAATDVRHESELTRAILAFYVPDETMTAELDAWVAAQPKSWPAHLARSKHFVARGFAERGGSYRSKTSTKQFAGLDEWLRRATIAAREAMRINSNVVETYVAFIGIAGSTGDQESCLGWGSRALAIEPASARTYFAVAYCLLPRWGGSYEALEALAEEARAHVAKNPELAALAGFVDWDRGRLAADDEDQDAAIELYTAAIAAGEYVDYYESRARAYRRQKRYSDALADVAQGVALRPEDPDLVALRARVLLKLGRHRDAVADVRLVTELDPENDDLATLRSSERDDAVSRSRHLLDQRDVEGAIGRLSLAIALTGETAKLRFWRGRAYIQAQQFDRARADLEASIRLEPRAIESYRNLDWVLARDGRWDDIIGHWDTYLALEPLSGDAYLERSGTHHHKGDRTAALADANKACDLGVQKACDVRRRLQ